MPSCPPSNVRNTASIGNWTRISLRAARPAQSDLARPLRDRDRHDGHHADAADHQREWGDHHQGQHDGPRELARGTSARCRQSSCRSRPGSIIRNRCRARIICLRSRPSGRPLADAFEAPRCTMENGRHRVAAEVPQGQVALLVSRPRYRHRVGVTERARPLAEDTSHRRPFRPSARPCQSGRRRRRGRDGEAQHGDRLCSGPRSRRSSDPGQSRSSWCRGSWLTCPPSGGPTWGGLVPVTRTCSLPRATEVAATARRRCVPPSARPRWRRRHLRSGWASFSSSMKSRPLENDSKQL